MPEPAPTSLKAASTAAPAPVERDMDARADHTIEQEWDKSAPAEHARWRALFARQAALLRQRATPEFLAGLEQLGVAADGIPDFRRLNDVLTKATNWR